MSERDKHEPKPVYEQIVERLEAQGAFYVATYYLKNRINPRSGTAIERAVIIVVSPRNDLLTGFERAYKQRDGSINVVERVNDNKVRLFRVEVL